MKVVADEEAIEYDHIQRWWRVCADDRYQCLPMAITGDLPMALKKSVEIAGWSVVVPRSATRGTFMFPLVIRIRFVYGFRLVWNSSPSRIWL